MSLQAGDVLPASVEIYPDQLTRASLITSVVKAFLSRTFANTFQTPTLTHTAQMYAHNTKGIHSAKR